MEVRLSLRGEASLERTYRTFTYVMSLKRTLPAYFKLTYVRYFTVY